MPRTEVRRIASGRGLRRRSGSTAQIAVDPLDVGVAQSADRLLQFQRVDDEVVVGLREVEACLVYLLLLVEHIEVGPYADFEPELVGVVRYLRRFQRLLEGLDLRHAAGHARERSLR